MGRGEREKGRKRKDLFLSFKEERNSLGPPSGSTIVSFFHLFFFSALKAQVNFFKSCNAKGPKQEEKEEVIYEEGEREKLSSLIEKGGEAWREENFLFKEKSFFYQ